jgi:glycerol-3-phosphate acyltransferase PlsY
VTDVLLKVALCYLLGSLVGSLVVGRLRGGVDIRTLGSGNPGGTNALRTQGKVFALWVMVIDIGKGWLATRVIARLTLPGVPPAPEALQVWTASLCGIAVMVGHVYPIWYGFRGGKGVATLVGAVLGLDPLLLVVMLLTWAVVVFLGGYIGLASMTAAASLPVAVAAMAHGDPGALNLPLLVFGLFAFALVLYTHRSNIARMRAGTEPRSKRLWLLGRRGT